jgi:intergrase/recombinase
MSTQEQPSSIGEMYNMVSKMVDTATDDASTPEQRELATQALFTLHAELTELARESALEQAKALFPFELTDKEANALLNVSAVREKQGLISYDFNRELAVEMRKAFKQKHENTRGVFVPYTKYNVACAAAAAAVVVAAMAVVIVYVTRK